MSTIEEELRRLAAVAGPLVRATEEANAAIQTANTGIATSAPGVEVWLREDVVSEIEGYGWCLGVTKVKGGWQVAVRPCRVEVNDEGDLTAAEWLGDEAQPLAEASRETRLIAASMLPMVIRKLTAECQRLLAAKQRALGNSP